MTCGKGDPGPPDQNASTDKVLKSPIDEAVFNRIRYASKGNGEPRPQHCEKLGPNPIVILDLSTGFTFCRVKYRDFA